jgi:DnaJ-domain-containing protein 1
VDAIVETLSDGAEAAGSTDPRAIKAFAGAGPVCAVLVTENFARPSPETLAAALQPALPDTAFLLLERQVSHEPPVAPFHARLRFPVDGRVLLSKIRRTLRQMRSGGADLRELHAEVELRSLGLEGKTHYEVLGVERGAPTDDITRAYDRLSLAFHPDRLRLLDDEARAHGMQLYLRIGEAYRTLRSPGSRMRYDHALDAGGTHMLDHRKDDRLASFESLSNLPAARKHLGLAQRALIGGDWAMALTQLKFAHSIDVENSLIASRIKELEEQRG